MPQRDASATEHVRARGLRAAAERAPTARVQPHTTTWTRFPMTTNTRAATRRYVPRGLCLHLPDPPEITSSSRPAMGLVIARSNKSPG